MRIGRSANQVGFWILAAAALSVATAGGALAQEADVDGLIERGAKSYLSYCGSCHGDDAKGDGLIAPYLKTIPPDLTQINARNQGEFPFDQMYDIVDGRDVPGHGTRAMPVWGPAFMGMDEDADRKSVKEKVVELVYYLKSIQPPIAPQNPKMGGAPE